ncbi:MAG TPA: helix-turn-helix domain-containing protein [Solirubrobacteraceae bacterium]|nr:helix-turn-helix domain-containing protein [Solirubrobacteraceae bacterium]
MKLTVTLADEQLDELRRDIAAEVLASLDTTTEPWLTVEQAAAHLALSTSQIYTLCSRRSSGFPVTKEGQRSFFRASELDRWRETRASQGASSARR